MTDTIDPSSLTRRRFVGALGAGAASLALAACTSTRQQVAAPVAPPPPPALPSSAMMYGPIEDGGFSIPPVPVERMEGRFLRQIVRDPTGEMPGTVVVDVGNHFLYLVRPGGEAMRYGVGLGRQGFEWSGRAVVEWKQPWPRWFPPDEMIDRQPELEKYRAEFHRPTGEWRGGMDPGLENPLGARALYLYEDGVDTLYRIHGSPEWWSIGRSVSSGCVRLMNQDIIDLYDRVPEKSPVLVSSGFATV